MESEWNAISIVIGLVSIVSQVKLGILSGLLIVFAK